MESGGIDPLGSAFFTSEGPLIILSFKSASLNALDVYVRAVTTPPVAEFLFLTPPEPSLP